MVVTVALLLYAIISGGSEPAISLNLLWGLCAVRISFLDIPEENTLHYLSGKVIKLKDPQIVKQFDGLDKINDTNSGRGL